ncbi:LTA synthase family protein [Planctobacterium marinum]|uniref:LTA synthase family protein n=1 Tax=Planctobacterium marinum TaxID=1631968 RepID=UPI001E5E18D7|nr:LTA synthase family protein [Planctobacterium marinum]MCC2604666.1 LTA synthase family protein [Planctobacterium marinum]
MLRLIFNTRNLDRIYAVYCSIVLMLVAITETATPSFIAQYDVRPNRLFVEYLEFPSEVFSMLVHGHLLSLIISLVVCCIVTVFSFKYISRGFTTNNVQIVSDYQMAGTLLAILLLSLLAARGTVGHRPLNPSLVYFAQDALLNSLTLNSLYSVAFAIKNSKNEKSSASLYGKLPKQEIIKQVRQAAHRKNYLSEEIPTLSVNSPVAQFNNKNLVVILEESLGARFVGHLGGSGLTPELDKLYRQGWGFTNMYATGTRSVRGIEALTTGFIPSPSRAVVKLSKSQKQFFTIASALSKLNYTTQFVYGGESHFDNMKSFFLGNGFTSIVDFHDIDNPNFVSSWGVSDEDLFIQANIELNKLHAKEKPFFSLIFTSSNHDPFLIPQGKVSLPDGFISDNPDRDLAIKYADYALGQFINNAKTQEYWRDTIFLIVADHDVRVYGSEPVPIKSFHIPAVILNSEQAPNSDSRLTSQIDLPVTLLSLLGVDIATPMVGFDLNKHYPVERAMMQYYDNFAYLENNQAVILMPNQQVSFWQYNPGNKSQTKVPQSQGNEDLKTKALAHVLFSTLAYSEHRYHLADR